MSNYLKVLDGGKKERPDYINLYWSAFLRKVTEHLNDPSDKEKVKQVIFYGVKAHAFSLGMKRDDYEFLRARFQTISFLIDLIGQLTPAEFVMIFPVDKKYGGAKWQMRDYFFTMQELQKLGMDKPIGESAFDMVMNFQNLNVSLFAVESMGVLDSLRRAEGKKGMIEEFFGVTPSVVRKDKKGRKYLIDGQTGETVRLKRRPPRYLKLIPASSE